MHTISIINCKNDFIWITGFLILVTFHFAKNQDTTQHNTFNGDLLRNYIQLQAFVHQLHEEIQAQRGALSSVQAQLDLQNDLVGFTVCPSTPDTNLTLNTRIIFDRTITNIGNAYNPSTGSFICPRHGLYQFTIAVYCFINDTGLVDLMKGNEGKWGNESYKGSGKGRRRIYKGKWRKHCHSRMFRKRGNLVKDRTIKWSSTHEPIVPANYFFWYGHSLSRMIVWPNIRSRNYWTWQA